MDERLGWMLLGGLLGFVLGYMVRSLREIKREVDEIDEYVHHDTNHYKDESGAMRNTLFANLALFLVVALAVFASFSSQLASNEIKDTQQQVAQLGMCNRSILSKTIVALNERTTFNREQAIANVRLQNAQAKFLGVFRLQPAATDQQKNEALSQYFESLTVFVNVSSKAEQHATQNPYPTDKELRNCLTRSMSD